jgi:hypothetical protein
MRRSVAALLASALVGCSGPVGRFQLRIHTQTGATYRAATTTSGDGIEGTERSTAEITIDAAAGGVITLRSRARVGDFDSTDITHVNVRGEAVDTPGDGLRAALARDAWPDAPVGVGDTWETRSAVRSGTASYTPTWSFCATRWTLVSVEGDATSGVAILDGLRSCEDDREPGRERRSRVRQRVSLADALLVDERIELLDGDRVVRTTEIHVERAR